MYEVPSYTKVLTIGARGTEHLLRGEVVVQEKVDGSQFAFGIDAEGNIGCRSHHQQIDMNGGAGMFEAAVAYVREISPYIGGLWGALYQNPITWYCEYLQRPKQNVLAYDRTPTNHLVLFDMSIDGEWQPHEALVTHAHELGIDAIPQLYRSTVASLDELRPLLETKSYLGGQTVEGIVIKNYAELLAIGGRTYQVFCKWVNAAFKERNAKNWAKESNKGKLEAYLESFCAEGRWQKAVQHLRERGVLLDAPQDIGPLIKEIQRDVEEEEAENIKRDLYRMYIEEIKRHATRRFPEWYKEQLAARLAGEEEAA